MLESEFICVLRTTAALLVVGLQMCVPYGIYIVGISFLKITTSILCTPHRSPGKSNSEMVSHSGGDTTSGSDGHHRSKKRKEEEEWEEEEEEKAQLTALKRTKSDKGGDNYHFSHFRRDREQGRLKSKGKDKDKGKTRQREGPAVDLVLHTRGCDGADVRYSGAPQGKERPWIAANLKVRLVDRSFRKGQFYNQKASEGVPPN